MNELKVNLENPTTDERKQLAALIEKSQKPEIIKCTEGDWFVRSNGVVCHRSYANIDKIISYESYFTKEEAEKENTALTELRIINNIIRQENKRTGFVADWSDTGGEKYSFYFSHSYSQFYARSCYTAEQPGGEVCNQESASKIKDWLDRGMIEGITRGKIK